MVSVFLPSDALLQHLSSFLDFSYLGLGVSLHGCSSKVQPLLFNLEERVEVVKQAMARVNINILGISELKWTGMGEFSSDDHYIYYCGQGSLRRNRVSIMVNKRV